MVVALWIVGGATALLFFGVGALKLVASKRWLSSKGMTWVDLFPAWLVKVIGILEMLGAVGIVVGLLSQGQYAPLAWWLIAAASAGLLIVTVGAIITHVRRHEKVLAPASFGTFAVVVVLLASLLATEWPGGVPAPTVAVPANPLWKGDTKPDPVPEENVVLSLPDDMYRHKDAPTEWWWHIGTLRAGDRVFGFEINAASFVGQGFAMTQVSLTDAQNNEHYERTQVYVTKPIGVFDVANWAEGDPSKDWYARLGDPSWQVGGFSITGAGAGYKTAPTVKINGDGTGASALAVLDAKGGVGQIVLVDPGTGYTTTPTISLEGGGGSGATAVAVRSFVSMTAPQADPTQNISVQSLLVDETTPTEVEFDLNFSQQGRPFFVFGTGLEPSAKKQSLTEDNYYFSYTHLKASGTITIDGEAFPVTGTTWMDHEYGFFGGGSSDNRVRWLLQDMQLNNGYTISNAGIIGEGYKPEIGVTVDSYATIQDADGNLYYVASTVTPVGALWVSPKTGNGYAQQFLVEIPSFDAELTVSVRVLDQEFAVTGAPIYEGIAGVEGTLEGSTVTGDAWIEQAF